MRRIESLLALISSRRWTERFCCTGVKKDGPFFCTAGCEPPFSARMAECSRITRDSRFQFESEILLPVGAVGGWELVDGCPFAVGCWLLVSGKVLCDVELEGWGDGAVSRFRVD